jgi:LmbE family N-acetylglucosaminyl deacetylase
VANRILGIFAHPDDETFFCGGVLAQHAAAGDEVHVVILSDGVQSRYSNAVTCPTEVKLDRAVAFQRACDILGVHTCGFVSVFSDQRADQVSQLAINKIVEVEIAAVGPARVYTHFAGDLNLDHRRVAEAVLVATRMGPPVYCAEPEFPARCVGLRWPKSEMRRVNIEATLPTKLKACEAYGMELRPFPHPRSLESFQQRRSECFVVIR